MGSKFMRLFFALAGCSFWAACGSMEEMVEPDRTITIVSIIGLVIIWGSFFYHKFVQGGGGGPAEQPGAEPTPSEGEDVAAPEVPEAEGEPAHATEKRDQSSRSRRKKSRKRR